MRTQPPHPWITFSALSLLFFVVSAGTFSSLGVLLPAMVRELNMNWKQAGMGYAILGVACGLMSLAPALLIRRIGVRGAMAVGSALLVAGFGAMALAQTAWHYLLGTLLIGTAFALTTTVPATHVLTGIFQRRSTVIGAYFTIGALGQVAGPMLFVAVNHVTNGWRSYWVVFVLLAIVAGVFAILTTPPRQDESEHQELLPPEQYGPVELIAGLRDWTVRRALGTWQFYVIVTAYTTYLLINTTAHGFAVAHLTERGVSADAAAEMLSLEALIGAGLSVVGGVLGERISAKTLLVVALGALTLGMWGLAEARGWGLMTVYAIGVGVGFGLTAVFATVLLLNYFGKRANLELYSIMCTLSTLAAAGPAIGGWARDRFGGFNEMFLVCTALTFVMLVATLFLHPPVDAPATAPRLKDQPSSPPAPRS